MTTILIVAGVVIGWIIMSGLTYRLAGWLGWTDTDDVEAMLAFAFGWPTMLIGALVCLAVGFIISVWRYMAGLEG